MNCQILQLITLIIGLVGGILLKVRWDKYRNFKLNSEGGKTNGN